MQAPIPVGTVLQNRYCVLSVLGQGGFGRTYLTEDRGRFNERCALKEFIPPQGSEYALNKSRELFQREAAILYQIQHPQIPQFRATFEENQRLFLVQDYVEGQNYRVLLKERKAQGKVFSEAEVLRLIQQLLPVLSYIHSKGIIHRDIAPDNIILRQSDHLPILIDFGVVKEIATRVQTPDSPGEPTTVGKFGFAPSEQMQTGRAYPSSDLYALAVTALVLLTGREPQEMYDDRRLTWNWQKWTTISPAFAQVLNRMLNYRPDDRYQSAAEVLQALQPPDRTAPVTAPATPAPRPSSDPSQMRTVAVGRSAPITNPSTPAHLANARRTSPPVVTPSSPSSAWDNPLALIATAAGLAVVAGITTWAIVSALRNPQRIEPSTVVPTPTPSVSLTPTPVSPTPSPTPEQPIEYSQRLDLKPTGEVTTAEGNLRANESIVYVIPVEQGQTLDASLEGEGTLLTVLGPNREPVEANADRVPAWQGPLSDTGEYYVRISPVKGVTNSDYKLNLTLQAAPTPSPTESPSPSPTESPSPSDPVIDTQPLSLPVGSPIQFSDKIARNTVKRYQVEVQPGQVLAVEVLEGPVTLDVRYPDGRLVENASGVTLWSGQATETGRYQIDVMSPDPTDFTLKVGIQNQASQ